MSIWHAIYVKCPYKSGVEITSRLLGPFTMTVRLQWWRHKEKYMVTVHTPDDRIASQGHVTMSDELELHR